MEALESKDIVNAYGGGKLIFPGKSERPMAPPLIWL